MSRYRLTIDVTDGREDALERMRRLAAIITEHTGLSVQLEVIELRELYLHDEGGEQPAATPAATDGKVN